MPIYYFPTPFVANPEHVTVFSRIFHLHDDVTIACEGLQNLDLMLGAQGV
jgi:hypothetical protein